MQIRLLVWTCVVLFPGHLFAQGTVAGTARDIGGMALPGVTVELAAAGTEEPLRTSVTYVTGRYEFRDVPVGTYALTFRLPGFEILRHQTVTVFEGAPTTVDAVLQVAPLPMPPLPPGLQPGQGNCLHGDDERADEYRRRREALEAMRLIDFVIGWTHRQPGGRFPTWDELAGSPAVASMRGMPGPSGSLARRIAWGASEPLPGWSITYVATDTGVTFALSDVRDPCGFTYTSEDPEVIPRGFHLVPLQED